MSPAGGRRLESEAAAWATAETIRVMPNHQLPTCNGAFSCLGRTMASKFPLVGCTYTAPSERSERQRGPITNRYNVQYVPCRSGSVKCLPRI